MHRTIQRSAILLLSVITTLLIVSRYHSRILDATWTQTLASNNEI